MRQKFFHFSILIIFLFPFSVQADIENISVCHQKALKPPYLMLDTKGLPIGIMVEALEEVIRRGEAKLKQDVLPWKRCLAQIKFGEVDLTTNSSHNKDREEYAIYTNEFYRTHFVHVYDKKAFPSPPKIETVDDLAKYKVGGVLGFNYSFYNGKVEFDTGAKNQIVLIKKLRAGRVDIAALQKEVILRLQKEGKIDLKGLGMIPDPVRPVKKFFVLISKKHPNPQVLLKMINDGIASIRTDGTLTRLKNKYLSASD